MSQTPYRSQGFNVGTIGNLRNDIVADYYAKAIQDAQVQRQLAQQQQSAQENDQGINWLNALGLGALAAGLGAGAYALTRRPPSGPPPGGGGAQPPGGPSPSPTAANRSSRKPSTQPTTASQANRRSAQSPQKQPASQPQPSQPRPQVQQSQPLLPPIGETSARYSPQSLLDQILPNEGRPTPVQIIDLNRVVASRPQVQDTLEQTLSTAGPNIRQNTQDLAYRLLNNQINQNPIQARNIENDPAVLRALYALESDSGFQQRLDSSATRQDVYTDPQSGREVFDLISTASPSEFSKQARVARNLEAETDRIIAELRGINTSSTVDLNPVLPEANPNAQAMESGTQQSVARQQKTAQQQQVPEIEVEIPDEIASPSTSRKDFLQKPISLVSLIPQNQVNNVDPGVAKIVDAIGRNRFNNKTKETKDQNKVKTTRKREYKPLTDDVTQEIQNQTVQEANAQKLANEILEEVSSQKVRPKDATRLFPEELKTQLYDAKTFSQVGNPLTGSPDIRRLQPAAALQFAVQFGDELGIPTEQLALLGQSIIPRTQILKQDLLNAQTPQEKNRIRKEIQKFTPRRITQTKTGMSVAENLDDLDRIAYLDQQMGTFKSSPEINAVLDAISIAAHDLLKDDHNATVASRLVGINPGEMGPLTTKGLGWTTKQETLKDKGIKVRRNAEGDIIVGKTGDADSHKVNQSDLSAVFSVDLGSGIETGTAKELGISHDLAENAQHGSGIGDLGAFITHFQPRSPAIGALSFLPGSNASGKVKNLVLPEEVMLATGEDTYSKLTRPMDYLGQYVGGIKGFYGDSGSFEKDITIPKLYENQNQEIKPENINQAIIDKIIQLSPSKKPGDSRVYSSLRIPNNIVFSDINVARNYANDLSFSRRYGIDELGRTRTRFTDEAVDLYKIKPYDNAAENARFPLLYDYNNLAAEAAEKAKTIQNLLSLKEIDDTTYLIPSVPSIRTAVDNTATGDKKTFGSIIQDILARPSGSYQTKVSPTLSKRKALQNIVLSANPEIAGIVDPTTGGTIGLLRSVGNKGGFSYLEPTKIQMPVSNVDEGLSLLLALDDKAQGTKPLTPIDKQRLRGLSGRKDFSTGEEIDLLPEKYPLPFLSKAVEKYSNQMEDLGIRNRDAQVAQSQSNLENAMDRLLQAVRENEEISPDQASRFLRSASRINNEEAFLDVLDPLSPEYNEEIALGVSAFRPDLQDANLDLNEQRNFNQDLGGTVSADSLRANYDTALEDVLSSYGSGFFPMKPRLSSIYDYNVAAPLGEVPSKDGIRIKQIGGRINEPLLLYGVQRAQRLAQKQLPLRLQYNQNISSLDDAIEASELRGYQYSGNNPILTRAMIDAATLGQFSSPYRLRLTKQAEIVDPRKTKSDQLYNRPYDGPETEGFTTENPESVYNNLLQSIDRQLSDANLTTEETENLYTAKTNLLAALANYRSPDGSRKVVFKDGIPVGIISDAQRRAHRAQAQASLDALANISSDSAMNQPEISVVRRQSNTGGRSRNIFAEDVSRRRSASNTLSLTDINDLLQQQKEQDDYVPTYKSVIADMDDNTNKATFEIGDMAFDPLENIELTPRDLAVIRNSAGSTAQANQIALRRQAQRNNLIYDAIQKLYKPGVQSVTMQVGQRGGLGNLLNATETINKFGMTPEQLRVFGNISLGNAQQMRDSNRRMRNNERALESPEVSTLFSLVPEATRTSPETQLRLAQMLASVDPETQPQKAMTLRGLLAQRQAETLRKAVPLVQELDPTKQARLALLIDAMKPGQQLTALSNLNANLREQIPFAKYSLVGMPSSYKGIDRRYAPSLPVQTQLFNEGPGELAVVPNLYSNIGNSYVTADRSTENAVPVSLVSRPTYEGRNFSNTPLLSPEQRQQEFYADLQKQRMLRIANANPALVERNDKGIVAIGGINPRDLSQEQLANYIRSGGARL